ncbi:transposase, partial [Burkholderia cenocepacia]|uniref:transposase n=1 Tax=Burkholderia cenocepacia TaxID=95486 RepID=UPI00222FB71F
MTSANAYPDDIEALKAMLLERDARIGHLEDVVESHEAANATAKAEIEHLKLTIAKLRRMQFGRKSEKIEREIEQLELRLEDLQADEGAAGVAQSKPVRKRAE